MTYLQAINAVLRRLREDEVSTYTQSDYSKLIGDFVNESKREVEDAWNWIQLRSTVQVSTVSDTYAYTLTGAGNRYRILQVINDTQDTEMRLAPYTWMNRQFTISDASTGAPLYYDINGDSSGDPTSDIFPIPDAVYTLNYNMIIPQDDLSSDSTSITVPTTPVILGAYAKAISERGEDSGVQFAEAMSRYDIAMSDAIAIDSQKVPDELNWTVN